MISPRRDLAWYGYLVTELRATNELLNGKGMSTVVTVVGKSKSGTWLCSGVRGGGRVDCALTVYQLSIRKNYRYLGRVSRFIYSMTIIPRDTFHHSPPPRYKFGSTQVDTFSHTHESTERIRSQG